MKLTVVSSDYYSTWRLEAASVLAETQQAQVFLSTFQATPSVHAGSDWTSLVSDTVTAHNPVADAHSWTDAVAVASPAATSNPITTTDTHKADLDPNVGAKGHGAAAHGNS